VTDSASWPASTGPDRLRFRASKQQALFIALPFLLIVAAEGASHLFSADGDGRGVPWLYAIAAAVVLAAMIGHRWFGVTLTADGLHVHSLRRRTIPWQDVTAIRAEEFEANRVVAIYELGHRRTRLRYPTTGSLFQDQHFDAKVKIIQDWWAECSLAEKLNSLEQTFG
jgi:hypothetical protein